MTEEGNGPANRDSQRDRWARLRFAVVGPLLAAPPPRGELNREIARLALRSWRHLEDRAADLFQTFDDRALVLPGAAGR